MIDETTETPLESGANPSECERDPQQESNNAKQTSQETSSASTI